jgi:hypothetical protein
MIIRWISDVPSKIVKLSDVAIGDQHTCSRQSRSPGDEPLIVDGLGDPRLEGAQALGSRA